MDESILALSNCYLSLLSWFIMGLPSPLMKDAYRVKDDIEKVLRVLTNSQLTGVELALAVKDKFSRDALSEAHTVCTAS